MHIVLTGAAGFIGSHLLSSLLAQGHTVTAVDNLWTGSTRNLEAAIEEAKKAGKDFKFRFVEQNICDFSDYTNVDLVYHLAALGSVPRSIENPTMTHETNVNGFLRTLNRARKAKVQRFVYASSSSVYGDLDTYYQCEPQTGSCLSPYAATKRINEIYAQAFTQAYGLTTLGLRFFNVYGPRQNPDGPYAAVIPRWIRAMTQKLPVDLYGTGENTRDFTYVGDVVRALNKAGFSPFWRNTPVLNVGTGQRSSLNELFNTLAELTGYELTPNYHPPRPGDKKHSLADMSLCQASLGFRSEVDLRTGLKLTLEAL